MQTQETDAISDKISNIIQYPLLRIPNTEL